MLKEKGHYFELPIADLKIELIVYDGLIRLVLQDTDEKAFLDLHGAFEIKEAGHVTRFSPRQKEALILFYDWFQAKVTITDAKADRHGRLFIQFSNRQELVVEDGPFENWHFTVLNQRYPKQNLFVHGGVGTTYY